MHREEKQNAIKINGNENNLCFNKILFGFKYSVSTHIDEDSILMGYGELHCWGFEYNLPDYIIKRVYKTTSWSEWSKLLKTK